MRIANWDAQGPVLLIAEIGNNHEGSFTLAEELVGRAAEAGASAVKFQTFRTEHYVAARDAERFARLKRFELSSDQFARLARQAEQAGLNFLSTPFDLGSVAALDGIGVPAFKISSGDNTFYPLIEAVAATGKPILLSGGLADLDQLRYAEALARRIWSERGVSQEVAVLHCVTAYPTPPEEASLATITTLRQTFAGPVGYSDHTLGIEAAVLAVALGARIIEKHFTVDRAYSDFRDHQLSADPAMLAALAGRIRESETLLGDPLKRLRPSERPAAQALRRSIVATRALAAGAVVGPGDITWVRPGGGLPPGAEARVLGRPLRRALAVGEQILPETLAPDSPA